MGHFFRDIYDLLGVSQLYILKDCGPDAIFYFKIGTHGAVPVRCKMFIKRVDMLCPTLKTSEKVPNHFYL